MEMPSVMLSETSSANAMPLLCCRHNQRTEYVDGIIALSATSFHFEGNRFQN